MVAASYYPRRVNLRVPLCNYAAEVNLGQPYVCNFGLIIALSATYFLNAGQMVNGSAFVAQLSDSSLLNSGLVPGTSALVPSLWGRGLTFVASAANARTIVVNGYDYLGQKMQWTGTMNGTTPVACPKAFMWITDITLGSSTDTTTVNIGYNNVMGLPFKGILMVTEEKTEAVAANAGTFTGALATVTAATATNADVRGTYLPSTVIPDGVNTFRISYMPDGANLHGNAQYAP